MGLLNKKIRISPHYAPVDIENCENGPSWRSLSLFCSVIKYFLIITRHSSFATGIYLNKSLIQFCGGVTWSLEEPWCCGVGNGGEGQEWRPCVVAGRTHLPDAADWTLYVSLNNAAQLNTKPLNVDCFNVQKKKKHVKENIRPFQFIRKSENSWTSLIINIPVSNYVLNRLLTRIYRLGIQSACVLVSGLTTQKNDVAEWNLLMK